MMRRTATAGFLQLDPGGRRGPTPDWPLPLNPHAEQAELERRKWEQLWTLPQAIEWERMRADDIVALYVRVFVKVTRPAASPKTISELRALDEKLGISPKALQRMRWEILPPAEERTALHAVGADKRAAAYVP
jgi:hypothetical protein